jgi:hypothetical protein
MIRICKNGKIHLTGKDANDFFEQIEVSLYGEKESQKNTEAEKSKEEANAGTNDGKACSV